MSRRSEPKPRAGNEDLADDVEALERTFEELRAYLWRHAQTMAEFDGSVPGKLASAAARFERYVVAGSGAERLAFARWAAGAVLSRLRRRPNVNPFKAAGRLPRPSPELLALAEPPALGPDTRANATERRKALTRWLRAKHRALSSLEGAAGGASTRAGWIERVAEHVHGERAIVFPPVVDWHEPLFQRPHQLALAYGRLGYRVVYASDAHRYDQEGVFEVGTNVLCAVGLSASELKEALSGADDVVASVSWTRSRDFLDTLAPRRFIYELIDELTVFAGYGEEMEAEHVRLARRANLVVATADKLLEKVAPLNPRTVLAPNGVDYEHFASAIGRELPSELRAARARGPVVGFYGALAKWVDYELLSELARAMPEVQLVLIGKDFDGSLARAELLGRANVHYLGVRAYAVLPRYLQGFDVALLPFCRNAVTASTSPIKLFEYMAGERPVVSTDLVECRKYPVVRIGRDTASFVAEVRSALAAGAPPAERRALRETALANTWTTRAETILASLPD